MPRCRKATSRIPSKLMLKMALNVKLSAFLKSGLGNKFHFSRAAIRYPSGVIPPDGHQVHFHADFAKIKVYFMAIIE